MNSFDSVLVILAAEALAVLSLLVIALFCFSRNRKGKEMAEIERFISDLEDHSFEKGERLQQFIGENCSLSEAEIETVLQQVSASERALFQDVIRLFLKREMALLQGIEQRIEQLAEPYQNLLANAGPGPHPQVSHENEDLAQKQAGLERINQQLVRQLDTAMKTIDEMSAEYTRVFSGNQTALELENSSKKMMQIFVDAERALRADLTELERR